MDDICNRCGSDVGVSWFIECTICDNIHLCTSCKLHHLAEIKFEILSQENFPKIESVDLPPIPSYVKEAYDGLL